MDSAIRTRELRKVYHSAPPAAAGRPPASAPKRSKETKPQITALDGIDLDVATGEIFGLLGPNGAGKSTTVGILTTRIRPTSGTAWSADMMCGATRQRPSAKLESLPRDRTWT